MNLELQKLQALSNKSEIYTFKFHVHFILFQIKITEATALNKLY